jgi:DNA-binding response OmpR family regulator
MTESMPHILIIEDEKEIRRFVRMALQADGLEVHEAETFQRGLIDAGTRRCSFALDAAGVPFAGSPLLASERVLTHLQLLKAVWGPSHITDTPYLRVFMGGLRKKVEADPSQPRHLV